MWTYVPVDYFCLTQLLANMTSQVTASRAEQGLQQHWAQGGVAGLNRCHRLSRGAVESVAVWPTDSQLVGGPTACNWPAPAMFVVLIALIQP